MTTTESIIDQSNQADLLILSTAGSVDDGKSTLIGRLLRDCKGIYEDQLEAVQRDSSRLNRDLDLALLTDGLKAEREQGITIDVAYRYFSTPKRRFIIADTPGHEQYTRNMVTGASNANLAIVLVDARQGMLTQSRRHGFIASLLGIPHIAVCVNKMDLVDFSEEIFEQIKSDFTNYAAKLRIPDLHFFPISALEGDNVVEESERTPWYHGASLLHFLETVHVGGDRNLIDFRFPVQYVNRPHLNFRGYCGTVSSGVVRKGDEIAILPSGKTSRVASIHIFESELDYAFAPQAVTLCLEDEIDIIRGDMFTHVGNQAQVSTELESMLVWMSDEPLKLNKTYLMMQGSQTLRSKVFRLVYRLDPNDLHRHEDSQLELNEIGRVQLQTFQPIAFDSYRKNRSTGSFILVDPNDNGTVGAGMIIERPKPPEKLKPDSTPKSANIRREMHDVSPEERGRILKQKACTVWLTGLSGSGKSTIGRALEKQLLDRGHVAYLLDGDNIRYGISRDLGFSAADREENIRRIAEVANLFNNAGIIAITSFISPYRASRIAAAEVVGRGRFMEVHVSTPLEVCESRDPKGLYKKVRAGEIENFTGISDPYEPPTTPQLELPTQKLSLEACIQKIIEQLEKHGFLF